MLVAVRAEPTVMRCGLVMLAGRVGGSQLPNSRLRWPSQHADTPTRRGAEAHHHHRQRRSLAASRGAWQALSLGECATLSPTSSEQLEHACRPPRR